MSAPVIAPQTIPPKLSPAGEETLQRILAEDVDPAAKAEQPTVHNFPAAATPVGYDAVLGAMRRAIVETEARVLDQEMKRCARLAVDVSRQKSGRYRFDGAPLVMMAAAEATGADIEHAIMHRGLTLITDSAEQPIGVEFPESLGAAESKKGEFRSSAEEKDNITAAPNAASPNRATLVPVGPGLNLQLYRCTACQMLTCIGALPRYCPHCGSAFAEASAARQAMFGEST